MKGRAKWILCSVLLSGCMAPSYWYEPPAQSEDGLVGEWQGMIRDRAVLSEQQTRMNTAVQVHCDRYADRLALQVSGQRLVITIGRDDSFILTAVLLPDGQFTARTDVVGDTLVHGAVPIFSFQPELVIRGHLDAKTGIGKGEVLVGPVNSSVGCKGEFRVSRASLPAKSSELAEPFHIQYRIDQHFSHDQGEGGDSETSDPSSPSAPTPSS